MTSYLLLKMYWQKWNIQNASWDDKLLNKIDTPKCLYMHFSNIYSKLLQNEAKIESFIHDKRWTSLK